jgi:AAA15 family ATPase/GTPase
MLSSRAEWSNPILIELILWLTYMQIRIKKFKKIDDVEVKLDPLNIFIGTNNSGKSSFIQGIQFAISSCQTLELKKTNWHKRKGNRTLSLDSSEYLYTPTSNIADLYHGKKLSGSRKKEDRNWMEFEFLDNDTSALKISRGKNGGFTTMLSGKALGEKLSDINTPYCVYVPGIAGIPVKETYEVPIAVKKSATRGDSNNYLRNILYTISKDDDRWNSFTKSINTVYDQISLKVDFDEHTSEYIHVFVVNDGLRLPLDSIGTGLLQVIQIFAYIEYFNPKIILLDEPDSHIHPTKQKLLAKELNERVHKNPELKIVFSTHSRYILESLKDYAKVIHFQNGNAFQDIKDSNILLDIGAADADYLFSKKELKYVVVTEDKVDNIVEKKQFLKKFLLANGLSENEFVLHSYEGSSKVDFAKILEGFVRKQIPTVKVLLHIDRDQKIDGDRELIKLEDDCKARDIIFFITKYQEIESYFCLPQHISKIYSIPIEDITLIYKQFISELEVETRRKLSNFILRERPEFGKNKQNQPDIALINAKVDEWYSNHAEQLTPGKELLGRVKNYIQTEMKRDPIELIDVSDALISTELKNLLE